MAMGKIMLQFFSLIILFSFTPAISQAAELCKASDRACVIQMLETQTEAIDKKRWRDQTYRELAKTLAFDGRHDDAIAVIYKIQTPDTQALAIRGVGMAVAETNVSKAVYDDVFAKLRGASETIEHLPSYAIALTYIAMAQAFTGDNDGAWATAADMENDALRHKAYGETAEIQAEKGDFGAAMKSIGFIESSSYQNKAYSITSKLFADSGLFDDALGAADKISNAYKNATALQYILDKQKPRERARD